VAELFCTSCKVTWLAQIDGVAVLVRATILESHDVVDFLSYSDLAFGLAVLAQIVSALQSTCTLLDSCPAS
jgi:hypothetical protein